MKNNMKRTRSGIVIAVILFLFSAVSLIYGIYMVRYSLGYVDAYTGMSAVPSDKVIQYVVSASSVYWGFGILFAACGFIILSLSGIPHRSSQSISHQDKAAEDIDAHPENNPYYIASPVTDPTADTAVETVSPHTNTSVEAASSHADTAVEAASSHADTAVEADYHIRPELASDSWLKDAFIKK